MAACLLALTIQLLEEALEIGHENVLAPQYFPLGEQLRKADVADHVIAVLAPILLGDAVEVEDFQYVGFRVSHINFQLHVGRVLRTVEVVLFLVFVPVVVLTGHDVAQDRRGGRQAAGALAEHELAVVAFAPDHHAVVFVIDAVDVFAGGDEFGHDEHRELPVADLDHLGDQFDLDPFFAGVPDVRVVDSRDAVGEDPVGMDLHSERVNGNDD